MALVAVAAAASAVPAVRAVQHVHALHCAAAAGEGHSVRTVAAAVVAVARDLLGLERGEDGRGDYEHFFAGLAPDELLPPTPGGLLLVRAGQAGATAPPLPGHHLIDLPPPAC
jgi:hypothetical protein